MLNDSWLKQVLQTSRVIAVVGLSENSDRPSYQVASYLKGQGYKIVPVNPKYQILLSETSFPDLISAQNHLGPSQIEIVDIFRQPQDVLPHVDEAIKIGAKIIWMQEGIEHKDAAKKAESAGLQVVMDLCLMKTHKRLIGNR